METEDELRTRIRRLERRLERERHARESAEQIADRRMRELWLNNQELDQRVADRTGELEQALAQLEGALNSGMAFLSNLSHEMRTPLNGILGMMELLDAHVTGPQPQSYLEAARTSALRLERLLIRMLRLLELRLGAVQLDRQTVELRELASLIEARWQLPAMKGQQLLTVQAHEPGGAVQLDVDHLHSILDELIDNAISHAEPGVIEVGLRIILRDHASHSGRTNGSELHAWVSDQGPGFEPERYNPQREFIVNEDSTPSRGYEGAGLGIALATVATALVGGSLEIKSDADSPTRADLILPVG